MNSKKLGRKRNRRFSKGDAVFILIVLVIFGAIAYSVTRTNPSSPTTSSSAPQASDFNFVPSGCVSGNKTGTEVDMRFFVNITYRFNTPLHYETFNLAGTFLLASPEHVLSNITFSHKDVKPPVISRTLTIPFFFPISGDGLENRTVLSLVLTVLVDVQESNEPLGFAKDFPISDPVTLSPLYPACPTSSLSQTGTDLGSLRPISYLWQIANAKIRETEIRLRAQT
jgi:hypothetical protein